MGVSPCLRKWPMNFMVEVRLFWQPTTDSTGFAPYIIIGKMAPFIPITMNIVCTI